MEDSDLLISSFPLLGLPFEIRNLIYTQILSTSFKNPQKTSQKTASAGFLDPHFEITDKKLKFYNHTCPSNIFFANHQVYDEFFATLGLKSNILQLTGDFTLGLSPTSRIFEVLERNAWITRHVKYVIVHLKTAGLIPLLGGMTAISTRVMQEHPWLEKSVKAAGLKFRSFEGGCHIGVSEEPSSWMNWLTEMTGFGKTGSLEAAWKSSSWKTSQNFYSIERCSLTALANRLAAFPNLSKVYIETTNEAILTLFPSPQEIATISMEIEEKGVEVVVLLKHGQVNIFTSMLKRHGVANEGRKFTDMTQEVTDDIDSWRLATLRPRIKTGRMRYRLLDSLKKSEYFDWRREMRIRSGQDAV